MTTIELSPGCERWNIGDPTKHSPADSNCLEALAKAGFVAFTGPAGLCGGKSGNRTALAIHRGRGTKWEVVFRENETDAVTTTTTNLAEMTITMLGWLHGRSLKAEENSVHAVAG